MKVDSFRIGFLLIEDFPLISYAAAIEPLRMANLLSGEILYDIKNLPILGARATSSSGSEVRATAHVGETVDFDLVLVVAGGDLSRFNDQRVFSWLRLLARRGVALGGISAGSVILARAGLMQNRRMTAHWEHAETLLETNPALLVERSVYVVDRDRMSCAGGTAAFDMVQAMISEHHGGEFSNRISDAIGHTGMRQPETPQHTGPAGRHRTTSRPVMTVIQAMQDHIADPLTLPELAKMAGVGERHLVRLFSEKLGQTPMALYRDMRLDKARVLVDRSTLNLTEIALACGFSNSAHFSQSYSTRFGHAPSHQRKVKIPA